MSHDGFNLTPGWRSVIVVPVSTSEAQARCWPTAVVLPRGSGDRGKLGERAGTLAEEALSQVEQGLRAALDLE